METFSFSQDFFTYQLNFFIDLFEPCNAGYRKVKFSQWKTLITFSKIPALWGECRFYILLVCCKLCDAAIISLQFMKKKKKVLVLVLW